MPKKSERTLFVNELLNLIKHNELTSDDLLDKTNVRRLSFDARKYIKDTSTHDYEKEIGAALRYMRYQNLTILSKFNFLSVTDKAKIRLKKHAIEQILITVPKKWDHKWRFVLFEFDIKMRPNRLKFVDKLEHLGFKRIQDSVYVLPYKCRKQIYQLVDFYQLKNQVFYLEVTNTNNETVLKKLFPSLRHNI